MTTPQRNLLNSYLTVKNVCERNVETLQSLPALADAYTAFVTRLQTITSLGQTQAEITTGVARDKQRLRQTMCDAALEVAGAIRSWAKSQKNEELADRAKYHRTTLLAGRATASADRCQTIHDLAAGYVGQLGDHGVTAETLSALQAQIDTFKAIIPKTRTLRAQLKTITAQLAVEFRAANELLRENLDRLILQFRRGHPALVADYRHARKIVAHAATHHRDQTVALPETVSSEPPLAEAA